ncbi:hypothetical protein [Seonamhaeicola sp.]|uniref:hypothetical protein n=1 Tax=Seonamhaeicola sp. TaxID=1912245 RepID=UPI00261F2BB1|nr:hypothetical protein [Seonamhaeicola sp.]
MKKTAFVLLTSLLIASCSSFHEVHYFKDSLKPTANYYKVEVQGYALLSSSRYVSGYYDRGAVQAYFGEITQPAKGTFVPLLADDPKKTGHKELVLLLSTNSDAISTSIGNLAKSRTVINSLSLIANKDKLEEAKTVASELSGLETDIQLFISEADTYLDMDTTSDTFNEQTSKAQLQQFLKLELLGLSKDVSPKTFAELQTWYLQNN